MNVLVEELVRSLGADEVIDYSVTTVEEASKAKVSRLALGASVYLDDQNVTITALDPALQHPKAQLIATPLAHRARSARGQFRLTPHVPSLCSSTVYVRIIRSIRV